MSTNNTRGEKKFLFAAHKAAIYRLFSPSKYALYVCLVYPELVMVSDARLPASEKWMALAQTRSFEDHLQVYLNAVRTGKLDGRAWMICRYLKQFSV